MTIRVLVATSAADGPLRVSTTALATDRPADSALSRSHDISMEISVSSTIRFATAMNDARLVDERERRIERMGYVRVMQQAW
jgi:hypothetical protein